jgi:hypothetical protein
LQSISSHPLALFHWKGFSFHNSFLFFFCGGCKVSRERLKWSSNVMVKWSSICKKRPHGLIPKSTKQCSSSLKAILLSVAEY